MQDLGEEENEQETGKQNGTLNLSRYIIGGLCLVLFLALTGVGYVQVEERRGGGLRPFVSAENERCIDCHMAKDVAVGGINDWKVSRHAPKGIGCVECHRAEKGEAMRMIMRASSYPPWSPPKTACAVTTKRRRNLPDPTMPRAPEFYRLAR